MYRGAIRKIVNGLNKDPFLYISFSIAFILFSLNTVSIIFDIARAIIIKSLIFEYFMQTLQFFLLALSIYNLRAKK